MARATAPAERQTMHRAAYEHFSQAPIADERVLAQIARHAGPLGMEEECAAAWAELGRRAQERQEELEAELFFTRALSRTGGEARRGEVSRRRGMARLRLGRFAEALADFEHARRRAEDAGDDQRATEVLLDEAMAHDWMDDFRAAQQKAESAERRVLARGEAPSPSLLLALGRSKHRGGRPAEALPLLLRAAEEAARGRSARDYHVRVVALVLVGYVTQALGRADDAAAALDEAIHLCEAHSDRLHLVAALNNRALLAGHRGEIASMVRDFNQVIALTRELGQPIGELAAEYNLAEFYLLVDRPEVALRHLSRARALEERRAGVLGRPITRLLELRIHLASGDLGAARELVKELRRDQLLKRERGTLEGLLLASEALFLEAGATSLGESGALSWEELILWSNTLSLGQERLELSALKALAELRAGERQAALATVKGAQATAVSVPNSAGPLLRRIERRAAAALLPRRG